MKPHIISNIRYFMFQCKWESNYGKKIWSEILQAWILLPDIPVDECTFCITFSFKAEGYTESTLIHRGCLATMSRLVLSNSVPYIPVYMDCVLPYKGIHSPYTEIYWTEFNCISSSEWMWWEKNVFFSLFFSRAHILSTKMITWLLKAHDHFF